MKSLQMSRQFLLTFPNEIIYWKASLITDFFMHAAHACIHNNKFDTACQIAKVLPDFLISNTEEWGILGNFPNVSMISLNEEIEQALFPDSVFHSYAQQHFFSPSLILVWVPEILGSLVWTGHFDMALAHADKVIAEDFMTDQTFGVNSPRAFSLLVKV